MKKFGLIFLILVFSNCTSINTKKFYNFYKLKPKTFILESIKYKNDKDIIYIYSFYSNVINRKIEGFHSLTYDTSKRERTYIKTEKKNKRKYDVFKKSSEYFTDFDFILQNYLDGKIDYLLSLQDSFSGAEIGSYYYIFDFKKDKVYKINAIGFDRYGKLIQ